VCLLLIISTGHVQQRLTADEIVGKSLKAHGGEALSGWETMVCKGDVSMFYYGSYFRGEFKSFAQKPDKIRVERNMTKFQPGMPWDYTYIYNGEAGWTFINLVPQYNPVIGLINKRYIEPCFGISYYKNNSDKLILKPEGTAVYVLDGDTVKTPAHIVSAVIESDTTKLYFDKNNFHLIQEDYRITYAPGRSFPLKRVYKDFKKFGDVIFAALRIEYSPGQSSSRGVKFVTKSIDCNVKFDPALFDELKQKK